MVDRAMVAVWMRLWLIVCVAVLTDARDIRLEQQWMQFKLKHSRQYTPEMEVIRRDIWEDHIRWIENHNRDADQGLHKYWLGEMEYTDLTHSETRHYLRLGRERFDYNSRDQHERLKRQEAGSCYTEFSDDYVDEFRDENTTGLPKQLDWFSKGHVTPVKDMQGCGACWAFAAAGAVESLHYKDNKKLIRLSTQQLLDCAIKDGCSIGGNAIDAFDYIEEFGLASEESYPYKSTVGECSDSTHEAVAQIAGFLRVKPNSDNALLKALNVYGPVTVAIQTGGDEFLYYKKGVFHDCIGNFPINHVALLVGYGSHNGDPVWILKDSQNPYEWGIDGFLYLPRDVTNVCRISAEAIFPTSSVSGAYTPSIPVSQFVLSVVISIYCFTTSL